MVFVKRNLLLDVTLSVLRSRGLSVTMGCSKCADRVPSRSLHLTARHNPCNLRAFWGAKRDDKTPVSLDELLLE